MKKILLLLTITLFFLFNAAAWARDSQTLVGLWGGYNFSMGDHINNVNNAFPSEVTSGGLALGAEFWHGSSLQIGFLVGYLGIYSFSDTLSSVEYDLSFGVVNLMLGVRFFIIGDLFISAATGYELAVSKPEIAGDEHPEYGDDALISMLCLGYDMEITNDIVVGVNFRMFFGFEQGHVFTCLTPAITISYQL
ncbi:MAG: hypothetical protein GY754_30500 [bacterium]|nr:hypothetical protein [bacterium]